MVTLASQTVDMLWSRAMKGDCAFMQQVVSDSQALCAVISVNICILNGPSDEEVLIN